MQSAEKGRGSGIWYIGLDKTSAPIDESVIYFGATRDFKDVTGKILPYSFIKSLGMLMNSSRYPIYKLYKCINRIVSPTKEDMTDYAMIAVLALKKDNIQGFVDGTFRITQSDAHLYRRVGLLFSISEDNQVGLFGLWPDEFYKGVAARPINAKIVESLLVNRPDFWKAVIIMVTSDYDWKKIFAYK